jgi:subtilisin family serine protease
LRSGLKQKGLVLGILGFFVGASVLSSISGNTEGIDESLMYGEFVPGEFIVKFKAEVVVDMSASLGDRISTGIPSIDALNEKHRIASIERLFSFSKKQEEKNPYLYNIFKINVPMSSNVLVIVQEYLQNPHVMYAEPNYIIQGRTIPNDPDFDLQWPLHNTGQTGGTPDADIDAPEAWDVETGNPDVIIAISDTGVDWDHPDLAANIWINEDEIIDGTDTDGNGFIDDIRGWDFVNDDSNPMDDQGHGTNCAGITSAVTDNNIGIAGICWSCTIMPVKGLNDRMAGTEKGLADGIIYAIDNGAKVISMSWGNYGHYEVLEDAANYAYSQGAVLVGAAGNEQTDRMSSPDGFETVIKVAATNYNDIKITASDYGYDTDVSAPGWDIYTTDFDDEYTYFKFCSSACPHVSGLAGLILSQDTTLTNDEVRRIIRANVDPYNSEYYIGTGRINAYKALTRYNGQPDTPQTPTGEISGRTGRTYTYTTSSVDPDGDQLYYVWDWGDGNMSNPIGPFDSGAPCGVEYAWGYDGNYTITVKATDQKGGESYWSDSLQVSMPLRHQTLLERLFEWILQLFEISTL